MIAWIETRSTTEGGTEVVSIERDERPLIRLALWVSVALNVLSLLWVLYSDQMDEILK